MHSSDLLVHVLVLIMRLVTVLAMPTREAQSYVVRHHRPLRLFSGSTSNGTSTTSGPRGKFSEKTSWISPLSVLIVVVMALAVLIIFLELTNRKSSKAKDSKKKDGKLNKKNKLRPNKSSKESPDKPSTQPPSSPKTTTSPNRDGDTNKDLSHCITMFNGILKDFYRINFGNLGKAQRVEYFELNEDLKKVKIQVKKAKHKDEKLKNGNDFGKLQKKLTELTSMVNRLNAGGESRQATKQGGTVQSAAKRTDDCNRKAAQGTNKKQEKTVVAKLEPTESELKSSSGVEQEDSSLIMLPMLGPTKKKDEDEDGDQDDNSDEK